MPYALEPFASIDLNEPLLEWLLAEHERSTLPQLGRLWNYYRNALAKPNADGGSSGAPAQSAGLPGRLTDGNSMNGPASSREVVIENDIAWRIHTLIDFMFPQPPKLVSRARDPELRGAIETILQAVIDANGGPALWQNAALFGSVYGWVDFLVHSDGLTTAGSALERRAGQRDRTGVAPSNPTAEQTAELVRPHVVIETVEAPRAIALVNRADYRVIDAYILHYRQYVNDVAREGWLSRLTRNIARRSDVGGGQRATVEVVEVFSATHHQRYEDGVLVAETANRLGRLPIVHVQNLAQPLHWEGLSDVEPLIPLQDELNTRLSDRANRVTMQSFRMWLGKGIDGFLDRPVGPGQMWFTDNVDAEIEGFGGDAESPSEMAHIEELREAMDKASGVTPAAAGHIKARVGNLTSENALRISLMGTLAKTKRKRLTYGAGISALCELILHALDVHDVFPTDPVDRAVELSWADPLPPDETRRINDALAKAQLGIPLDVLQAELGYPQIEAGAAAE